MNILKWFSKKAPTNELAVSVVPGVKRDLLKWKERPNPPPAKVLSDREMVVAMKLFRSGVHSLKRMAGESWRVIAPVVCPTPFAGCGFVQGRKAGMFVNHRIVLVEADDDYDYTEVCVLVDGVPTLILLARNGRLRITIIAGQDYLQEVVNPSGTYCDTLDDLAAQPEAIQKVMRDIFTKVYVLEMAKPDATEKLLEYAEQP